MTEPVVSIAFTVRLPWAAAIRADRKTVENRGRPIPEKYIGRRVGVHAAATWSKEGGNDDRIRAWWWGKTWSQRPPIDATSFSRLFRKVVAVARIADCHRRVDTGEGHCCQPWGDRDYITAGGKDAGVPAWHIVLEDIVPLVYPVGPVTGSLSVPWTLPPDVAAQVSDRYLDAP